MHLDLGHAPSLPCMLRASILMPMRVEPWRHLLHRRVHPLAGIAPFVPVIWEGGIPNRVGYLRGRRPAPTGAATRSHLEHIPSRSGSCMYLQGKINSEVIILCMYIQGITSHTEVCPLHIPCRPKAFNSSASAFVYPLHHSAIMDRYLVNVEDSQSGGNKKVHSVRVPVALLQKRVAAFLLNRKTRDLSTLLDALAYVIPQLIY